MSSLSLLLVMLESLFDLIWQWGGGVRGVRGRLLLWGVVLQRILWGIWKEHSRIIFEDKKRGVMMVIDSILCEVGSWLMVTSEFKDLSLNTSMMD